MEAPRTAPSPVAWTFDVRAEGPTSSLLQVDAVFAPGLSDALVIDPDAAPFVHDARYLEAGEWKPLARDGDAWRAPCYARQAGCRIRYSFALADAAAQLNDVETAFASAGVLVAPPSTWLLRPAAADGARFQVRVTTEGGAQFATAMSSIVGQALLGRGRLEPEVAPGGGSPLVGIEGATSSHQGIAPRDAGALASGEHAFEAATGIVDRSSFAVFGPFDLAFIRAGDARVQLAYSRSPSHRAAVTHASGGASPAETVSQDRGDPAALSSDEIVTWVGRAVRGLSAYYGTFPVSNTLVAVLPGQDSETRGETISQGGPAVVIRSARGLTAQGIRDDWVVTHELVHATLPSFGHGHAWLDEGIATYVEPIVRTRAGIMAIETFWRELVDGLPQGLPEAGDRGLERTHTWGRTYWGGALFCFVADVRIRTATGGARSFDDVVRALASVPLDDSRTLDVPRFLEVGDRSTGTSALTALYREVALAPGTIDLASLWANLGVRRETTGVGFDDAAPLAFVRTGITRPSLARSD